MQTLVLVCQYTCTVSPGLYMVPALFYLVTGLLLHMHSQYWVVQDISLLSGDWSVNTHAQSVLGCTKCEWSVTPTKSLFIRSWIQHYVSMKHSVQKVLVTHFGGLHGKNLSSDTKIHSTEVTMYLDYYRTCSTESSHIWRLWQTDCGPICTVHKLPMSTDWNNLTV